MHPNPEYKRLIPSAAKDLDSKKVDVILVSHEHSGHFDRELIEKLAVENNACIVSNESLLQEIKLSKRYTQPVDVGQTISVRGIQVTGVSAHHPQSFYPMGFLLRADGHSVYHAGDTQLLDDFNAMKADLALLPIGGNHTMDCVDAVRAVKAMKPTYAIPMHYDTFAPIKADPSEFQNKIEKSILKTVPVILKPGKSFKF